MTVRGGNPCPPMLTHGEGSTFSGAIAVAGGMPPAGMRNASDTAGSRRGPMVTTPLGICTTSRATGRAPADTVGLASGLALETGADGTGSSPHPSNIMARSRRI